MAKITLTVEELIQNYNLSELAIGYLDKELDWDHHGVDWHLNEIANKMIDWEAKLSAGLKLTAINIHDLIEKNPKNPELQRYE